MRIAQVSPLYERVPPVAYGGTERVVAHLTDELVARGHEVTLFASGDSSTAARLSAGAPRGLRLDGRHAEATLPHLEMIEGVLARAGEFDVLHFHTDFLHLAPVSRTGVTAVTTLHGRLDLPEIHPYFRRFAHLDYVSISNAQRAPMPWLGWAATIPHGMPADEHTLGLTPGRDLAFVGRFSPEKGFESAVEIAARAGRRLRVAAKMDPADERYIEERVKPLLRLPHVEYLGELGIAAKDALLGDSAALLFPIDWPEPFGLVMIEAMAAGTPVIAFRCGSVPEVIDEGVTGFVVANVDEAVAALDKAVALDRRAIRARFEERFSVERMADDYLHLYRELIERGAPHARDQRRHGLGGSSGTRAAFRAPGS
jgi:glycosyltransferase involved in cell wall biosynthesis